MTFAYCSQQSADRICQGRFKEPIEAFKWTHNCMTIYDYEWVGWTAPNNQMFRDEDDKEDARVPFFL